MTLYPTLRPFAQLRFEQAASSRSAGQPSLSALVQNSSWTRDIVGIDDDADAAAAAVAVACPESRLS